MSSWSFRASVALLVGVLLVGCAGVGDRVLESPIGEDEQRAKAFIEGILGEFEERDVGGVMRKVSRRYQGNRAQFETRIDSQLERVDTIDYEWYVDRVIPGDGHVEVKWHWDRRWSGVDTGNETRRSGETTFRLVEEDGTLKLHALRNNNPFL